MNNAPDPIPHGGLRATGVWYAKTLSQSALSLAPGDLGWRLNEGLKALLGPRRDATSYLGQRVRRGLGNLGLMRDRAGFDVAGKNVLELGTGWTGTDLVLFHLAGAKRIWTVDHLPLLRLPYLRQAVAATGSVAAEIPGADARLQSLRDDASRWRSVDEALESLGARRFLTPSADVRRCELPGGQVDLFYSESVLHRIPEATLRGVVAHVAAQLMAPAAIAFHRTDQKDINTLEHVGSNRWRFDYLGYGDRLWFAAFSRKLNYQNRLRESDFIDVFEAAGLRTVYLQSRWRQRDLQRLDGATLAARFRQKAPRDIITSASILITRPAASAQGAEIYREEVVTEVTDTPAY